MDTPSNSTFITSKEAASLTGYVADYITRQCRAGKIKSKQEGRVWFIDKESLLQYFSEEEKRKEANAQALARTREEEYREAQKARGESVPSPYVPAQIPFEWVEGDIRPQVRGSFSALAVTLLILSAGMYMSEASVRASVLSAVEEIGGRTITFVGTSVYQTIAFKDDESRMLAGTSFALPEVTPLQIPPDALAVTLEEIFEYVPEAPRKVIKTHQPFKTHTVTLPSVVVDTGTGVGASLKHISDEILGAYVNGVDEWVRVTPEIPPRVIGFVGDIGYTLASLSNWAPTRIATSVGGFENFALGVVGHIALAYDTTKDTLARAYHVRITEPEEGIRQYVISNTQEENKGEGGKDSKQYAVGSMQIAAVSEAGGALEGLAVGTYEFIDGLFGSVTRTFASLFAPKEAGVAVTQVLEPKQEEATATPGAVQQTVDEVMSTEEEAETGVAPIYKEGETIYNQYYTITTTGVSKEYVEERIKLHIDNLDDRVDERIDSGGGGGSGSVTSVDISGGSTGLSFAGGPVTSTGTFTLSGFLNIANGGTGTSTAPTYGQMLLGNSSGGYDLVATSSLGITGSGSVLAGITGQIPYYAGNGSELTATSSIFITPAQFIGIGSTSPYAKLSIDAPAGISPFSIGSSTGTIFSVNQTGVVGFGVVNPNMSLYTGAERVVFEDEGGNKSDWTFRVAGSYGIINFSASNGTLASPTLSLEGDNLGQIIGRGYDGGSEEYTEAASILFEADGEFGTAGDVSDAPGRIVFTTTPNGSATDLERMRITSQGYVGIATTTPSGVFDVGGWVGRPANIEEHINLAYGLYLGAGGVNVAKTRVGNNANTGFIQWNRYFDPSFAQQMDVTKPSFSFQMDGANDEFSFERSAPGSTVFTKIFTIEGVGRVGVGSTSPYAKFSINANNGDTNTTLFAIGSSTASATTTLFAISNIGDITIPNGASIISTSAGASGGTLTFSSNTLRAITNGVTGFMFGQNMTTPGFSLNSSYVLGWASGSPSSSNDTSFSRLSTGKIALGTGATGGLTGTFITENIGLGTTTPYAQLAIVATSTNGVGAPTTLFAIASTTGGTATSTLFSVSNRGNTTIGNSNGSAVSLNIVAATTNTTAINLTNGSTGGLSFNASSNNLQLYGPYGTILNATGNMGNVVLAGQTFSGSTGGSLTLNAGASSGGTDLAGANVSISAGAATGNATGGSILFRTSVVGSTGSTVQTLSERLRISNTGNVGISTTSPFANLSVHANNGDTNTTLFAIGSSTASATTTLFSVANTGNVFLGGSATSQSICGNNLSTCINFNSVGVISFSNFGNFFSFSNGGVLNVAHNSGAGAISIDDVFLKRAGAGIFSIGRNTGSNNTGTLLTENIGLGTTSPYAQLAIVATSTTGVGAPRTLFAIASTTGGTATSTLFSVLNNGYVGINNSAPPSRLAMGNVSSAMVSVSSVDAMNLSAANTSSAILLAAENRSGSDGAFAALYRNTGGVMSGGDRLGGFLFGGSSSGSSLRNAALIGAFAEATWTDGANYPAYLTFETISNSATARTEKMRLTANGNLGIGTTTPSNKLHVEGTDATLATFYRGTASSNVSTEYRNNTASWFGGQASTGDYALDTDNNIASAAKLSLTTGGALTVASCTGCSSDARLKDNVETITRETALEGIRNLRPVTFTWAGPVFGVEMADNLQYGFIAQEAEEAFPELVMRERETPLTPGGTYLFNYQGLISPIVAAIQELDIDLQSLASTSPLEAEEGSFAKRFFANIISWLANSGNGIANVFVGSIDVQEQICVDGECLTKDDIRALLELVGTDAEASEEEGGGGGEEEEPSAGGEGAEEPPVEEVPTEEPPAEEPSTEDTPSEEPSNEETPAEEPEEEGSIEEVPENAGAQ